MSDLISRQAAINALWKALYEYEDKTEKQFQKSDELDIGDWILHRIFVQNMNDIDRQTIWNLPTIEAEPVKHGRWERHNIYHGDDVSGYVDPDWRCSECGRQVSINAWYMYDLTDFCPHCGAKMDGKENENGCSCK